MTEQVCSGAALTCTFGIAPGTLTVIPAVGVLTSDQPAATVMDFAPMSNIASFGMCTSEANPEVASATAAAMGTPTPMPCIPVTTSPWAPGSPTVTIGGNPALTSTDTCMCAWAGVITITSPGQTSIVDDT